MNYLTNNVKNQNLHESLPSLVGAGAGAMDCEQAIDIRDA
jgi:hypothetical protein